MHLLRFLADFLRLAPDFGCLLEGKLPDEFSAIVTG
jgi:hypothetical protein